MINPIDLVLEKTGLYMMVGAPDIPWGPTGKAVYDRTYSRVKPNGEREQYAETVARVVYGNLALVYGEPETWSAEVWEEATDLAAFMVTFKILPAGRHLWASGVKGRQYLFNCHVAGWTSLTDHIEFTLLRLAEGGGVGANYSERHIGHLGAPRSAVQAHVVCDPGHPDYDALAASGALSDEYDADWDGAFEVEDTREGWAAALTELVESAYRDDLKHEHRVFDVSRIRPSGSRLKTMGGTASGPEPLAIALVRIAEILTNAVDRVWSERETVRRYYTSEGMAMREYAPVDWEAVSLTSLEAMSIDHEIAQAIVAGGTRRSARMSIVHWLDRNVFGFIACKADHMGHWSTNISVEIDDDFHAALVDTDHPHHEHAQEVLHRTTEAMLTNGEPGFWNSSLSNEGEPNYVEATNPCGEIALEAWENCNLGHVNLDAFVDSDGVADWQGLDKAHRLMTRFLMRATYGDVTDSKQAATLARNRRIGVGHFGVQGFLNKQGIKFSDAPHEGIVGHWLKTLATIVDNSAIAYAHDLRIPVPVKSRTVAPTGTIAKMPGRTEGIHPIYARHFLRRVRYSDRDPDQARQVHDLKHQGHHVEPDTYAADTSVVTFTTVDPLVTEVEAIGHPVEIVESADEISIENMLAFQRMYQRYWADNAVSFTVNVPAESHQAQMMADGYAHIPGPSTQRLDEVKAILTEFLPDLKGTTMMLDGSRPLAPYERLTEEQFNMWRDSGGLITEDASYDEECASGACPIK